MNFPLDASKQQRHSLAVCGSHFGEKMFLLIFILFDRFDQKQLFKQIQIFISIFPFKTWLEKQTF